MNVRVDSASGAITVQPPLSKAGDHIVFVAETDLIVALTACSAPQSNNGSFKPIDYEIGAPHSLTFVTSEARVSKSASEFGRKRSRCPTEVRIECEPGALMRAV